MGGGYVLPTLRHALHRVGRGMYLARRQRANTVTPNQLLQLLVALRGDLFLLLPERLSRTSRLQEEGRWHICSGLSSRQGCYALLREHSAWKRMGCQGFAWTCMVSHGKMLIIRGYPWARLKLATYTRNQKSGGKQSTP